MLLATFFVVNRNGGLLMCLVISELGFDASRLQTQLAAARFGSLQSLHVIARYRVFGGDI